MVNYKENLEKIKIVKDSITSINSSHIEEAFIGIGVDSIQDAVKGLQETLTVIHPYITKLLSQEEFKVSFNNHSIDVINNNFYIQLYVDNDVIYKVTVRDYSVPNMKDVLASKYKAKIQSQNKKEIK